MDYGETYDEVRADLEHLSDDDIAQWITELLMKISKQNEEA